MVKGLQIFQEFFQPFSEHYILIGGTACDVAFSEAGLDFRATKDLDIVLVLEALDTAFVRAFWDFIRIGQYVNKEKASGQKQFYRFSKPQQNDYPYMLELFSRKPDALDLAEGSHLTPLAMEESVAGLSAILLDDDCYSFILDGKVESSGLSLLRPDHLIPLKIHAWLNLCERQHKGEQIISHEIKKHRNDALRLLSLVDRNTRIAIPPRIGDTINTFIARLVEEKIDIKALGFHDTPLQEILNVLATIYVAS